jgi:membrane protein implicated in regulation of membrane protease activity
MEYIMAKRVTNSPVAVGNKGNGGLSLPKNVSWPSWLKSQHAGYIGVGLFGLILVIFLAGSLSLSPIFGIIIFSLILTLMIIGFKSLPKWVSWPIAFILVVGIVLYSLSLNAQIRSISQRTIEVAPVTEPFLRDDRGTVEQPTTRGVVVESVQLPAATELPNTHRFSNLGMINIDGEFTIQVQDIGLITFDPATGDRTLPGGKTLNSPPESNQGAFPDPNKSWGVLLIRQNGGEWVHAQEFLVQPGVPYEITLNVNQEYRRYVQYRPGISLNLYSE